MRVLKALTLVGAIFAGAHSANASPVSAGPTINLNAVVATTSATGPYSNFVVGESVSIKILMDGTVTRSGGAVQARFFSATGTFSFTGSGPGATFVSSPGVEAYTRAGVTSFTSPSGTVGIRINRPAGIVLNGPLFAVAPDFPTYLSYFTGSESSSTNFSVIDNSGVRMTFSNPSVIPLPAGGLLLIGGLGMLAVRRKMAA